MFKTFVKAIVLIILITLVVGCGKSASMVTPMSANATTMTTPVPTAVPTILPTPDSVVSDATPVSDVTMPIKPPATGDVPPTDPALGDAWVRPTDGAVMVYVPAGAFQMGSSEAEIDDLLTRCDKLSTFCDRKLYEPETPPHTVTLDGFWIDQFEITNAQFVAYLNEFGNWHEGGGIAIQFGQGYCRIKENDGEYWITESAADHPLVMVTGYGAEAYCRWIGGRLPTEAEWEYAARGPEGFTYPWGDDPPTLELTRFRSGTTAPVGRYPDGVSWCGVYDMAGNVWEWTADWFGRYPSGPQENPVGPASGTMQVLRGGGWHSPWQEVRSTFRLHDVAPSGYNG